LAHQHGLVPWVEFCGHLNDRALRARLRANQVLAVPSTYEGFGIAYLEGMGFGLPAIGARAGAAPELISHGRNGYLIDVGSARHLADQLGRLHADRSLLAKMGVAARDQWSRQPTWKQGLVRIENFLSSYNLLKS
jgi:glycosyltransferase involved in cell wall biosynthesis